ncbi:hypothetical protein M5689_013054 [Euphorbia peplus]|nr:hypothetical protein M5689_013054 [Euphorbia peplus]
MRLLPIDLNIPFDSDDENRQQENIDEIIQDEELSQDINHARKSQVLDDKTQIAIYNKLLRLSVDGKLKKGTISIVASQFSTYVRTIQHIWKQSKVCNGDVSLKMKGKCGRKRMHVDLTKMNEIPLHKRTTLASLASSLKVRKSTCYKLLKDGVIRRHTNAIKPFLKDENKISRLQFCISMFEGSSIPDDPIFKGMYNMVHIDEKWFLISKRSGKYYLLPEEEEPIRSCKSKNFIGKVMFLVAVTRPRFDENGNVTFSGKIGLFPLVTQEPAKRISANRVAATMETKPISSVTRQVIRRYLIDKVLPAIREKWPREDLRNPIYIQQDNARTHINSNDNEFCIAAKQDCCDIRLMCQPPNSPDLNILDLGFFNAIQALQQQERSDNIDDLIGAVIKCFEDFSPWRSNHIFLSLQLCMIEIMKAKGSNKYKIPHINKLMLERQGNLPTQLKCDSGLVQEILNYI